MNACIDVKPIILIVSDICRAIDHHYNVVALFEEKAYVKIDGLEHRYFGPYESASIANAMNRTIDTGVASVFGGYEIVLPVGVQAHTICKCLGPYDPFYFYVKADITEEHLQGQSQLLTEEDTEKQRVLRIAQNRKEVIVGHCNPKVSSIRLNHFFVEVIDLENDRWSFKYGA